MSNVMIDGHWYPVDSAAVKAAKLIVESPGYSVDIDGEVHEYGQLEALTVSQRVGNIERRLTLQDGSLFTTSDNDAIDLLFSKNASLPSLIHRLEGSFKWVLVAVFVTALSVYSFGRWGLPWMSQQIAGMLPDQTREIISDETLVLLDKHFFAESKINQSRQEGIVKHFNEQLVSLEDNPPYGFKLHFREWRVGDESIANALALPSGDIILTDRFIELCRNQQEMDSVILHEMGHVVHNHGLEGLLEGAVLSVIMMSVFGDSSALGDLVIGTGSLLLTSAYSRKHESEADIYAFQKMLQAGIDPNHFVSIMQRMTSLQTDLAEESESEKQSTEDFSDFVSSHPNTEQRIKTAREYSRCFQENKSNCP